MQKISKDKFVASKELKKFMSQIGMLMQQYSKTKKEDPEEFRNKIIKAYTFYEWMKISYNGLLGTLPIDLRAGLDEEINPKFKIMKGILDGFKQADSKLKKMTKEELKLTVHDDPTTSGFS